MRSRSWASFTTALLATALMGVLGGCSSSRPGYSLGQPHLEPVRLSMDRGDDIDEMLERRVTGDLEFPD